LSLTTLVYNMYQSNGACKTQCQGSWAFAIVQDTLCWCSNYIPNMTVDVSKCSDKCPGYPSDLCGNLSGGLYGYIPLTIAPLGIYGAAISTATSSVSTLDLPWTSPLGYQLKIQARQFDNDFSSSTTSSSTSAFTRTFFTRTTSSTSLQITSSILTDSLQASSSSTTSSSSSQLQTGTVSQTIVQTVAQNGGATTVVSYVTIV
jgi:cell wall integrity and stress response component